MKRQSLLAIAALLTLALVVCAGCKKGESNTTTTAGTKTPITFTFYNDDATEDMPFTDPVARKITEATGVTLKVDRPVGGDQQAIPIMIASGQLPDLIFAKGQLAMLVNEGLVIKLDDLIEKRGKNIKETYAGVLNRLRNTTEDPYIYNLGSYDVKTAVWSTDGTMQIQHAVLKDLGYPRMKTLDDYEKAIKAYKAKYPTINGRPTIGFSLLIDTWQWYIDLSNPSMFLAGYKGDDGQWFVDQNTLDAYYKFQNPNAKYYYQWLNRMYHEGVLDRESFTQTEDEWRAKIAQGRVLGIAYPGWGYGEARQSLINEGRPERTYAYLPIQIDERFTPGTTADPGFSGGYGIAITTACKDPERALEFLDWMASEEACILREWGIEGVNYDYVNRDGKRVRVQKEQDRLDRISDPNYGRRTGIGLWYHPFPRRGTGWIDSTGNYITTTTPELIKQNFLDVERETLAAYGAEMWTDLFPSPDSLGISRHGQAWQYTLPPDLQAKTSEADDYIKTALSNIVIGPQNNFDAAWDKIQNDLKAMGIDEANRALTALVKDKVKLWESK
jgi:putative aldouronate transport system substrate-binding protein